MQINQEENTVIFSWEKTDPNSVDFKNKIKGHYKNLADQNVVIDLSNFPKLKSSSILNFKELSDYHKQEMNKSFVFVVGNFSIDNLPDEISIAPTLNEALDIIDMEEIERDLGL